MPEGRRPRGHYVIKLYGMLHRAPAITNLLPNSGVARILERAGLKSVEQGQSIILKKRSSLFLSSQYAH